MKLLVVLALLGCTLAAVPWVEFSITSGYWTQEQWDEIESKLNEIADEAADDNADVDTISVPGESTLAEWYKANICIFELEYDDDDAAADTLFTFTSGKQRIFCVDASDSDYDDGIAMAGTSSSSGISATVDASGTDVIKYEACIGTATATGTAYEFACSASEVDGWVTETLDKGEEGSSTDWYSWVDNTADDDSGFIQGMITYETYVEQGENSIDVSEYQNCNVDTGNLEADYSSDLVAAVIQGTFDNDCTLISDASMGYIAAGAVALVTATTFF